MASMSGHDVSMFESRWESEPDDGHNTQEYMSQHNEWVDMYSTPAPPPTQETRFDLDGSELPPRIIRPPHRYLWPTPETPPQRRGGRRG